MLQQTPVARVEPVWLAWQEAWPTPQDLDRAPTAEVLRAWGRLGYPRRALRLQEAARAVVVRFGGTLPHEEVRLRTLPGVGEYTAAAVAAFAYGQRTVVLDTNVRRVLARLAVGTALPPPTLRASERACAAALLPTPPRRAAEWNAALMELGALVCTARAPVCDQCPLRAMCAWVLAGRPADQHAAARRTQPWHGTDRQARGRLLARVRESSGPSPAASLAGAWDDAAQRERALASLVADGLLERSPAGYRLPGG